MESALRSMATLSLGAGSCCRAASLVLRTPASAFLSRRTSLASSSSLVRRPAKLSLAVPPRVLRSARPPPVQVAAKAGYKLKTHKASAKRFRVTGSGKVVRRNAGRAHLLRKKSTKRKNRLAGMTEVFRGDIDNIVGALPYLKVRRVRNQPPKAVEAAEEVGEEEAAS